MKNLSLALNVILLVAVAVLFVLHFSGNKGSQAQPMASGNSKIGYINTDTVLKYYEFSKDGQNKLEAQGKKMEDDLKARASSLQNEFNSYQRNRGSLTIGQDQVMQEDLARKEQNFNMYRQTVTQNLMAERDKINQELFERIGAYLKKYGQQTGIQVVMKFDPTSDLMYASDSLDISKAVIDGLNAEFKNESVKSDSTATKK